jgi:hypothetical protein
MAEAAEDLYEVAPDKFTAARNALASRLRREGDRGAADEVKKMRRPSLTAWALNQVARQHPELIENVLEAGGQLREAMQQALSGDASGVRDAQAAERQAIDEAVAAGLEVLAGAGHPPSDTAKQRMAGTLHAAVVDDTVASRLRAGTLDEDRDAPGFGLGLEGGSLPRSSPPSRPSRPAPPPSAKGGGEDPAARRRAAQAAARAEAEERRQARVRKAELESEAERLARRAARLRTEADEAERQAKEARDAAEEAEKEATAAAQRLAEEGGDG